MSPYSWFAAERIDAVLPIAIWRPVFAGGLFRNAGRTSWGLTDERETKLAGCEPRAEQHGLGPIVWPDPWPTVDVVCARAMMLAERQSLLKPFALTAMRLSFKEGQDLGDPEVVAEAARRTRLDIAARRDPEVVAEAARRTGLDIAARRDPETKDALREATDAASARGVIGVPTVIVGDELFWGDDRLEDAAAWYT